MFLARTITMFVEALQSVFDADYPEDNLRDVSISVDFPLKQAAYPGLLVNFSTIGDIKSVGIGHVEYTDGESTIASAVREVFRWKFAGNLEVTVMALSSLERARMMDELVKTVAFGSEYNPLGDFRHSIENNDLIGMTMGFGAFTIGGFAETPGTPWGTDDVIYEATISMAANGEFVYDPNDRVLVPLSEVRLTTIMLDGDVDPTTTEPPWQ